jgi:tetratricopeptide (TPR) repeat protein
LSLLSACAASGPASPAGGPAPGLAAAYLTARFASGQGDNDFAADQYLRALEGDPANVELRQQAFITALLAGKPQAAQLAPMMADDQAAILLLAGVDAKAGRWEQAETRIAGLPRQGLAQILQPLLVAWTQAGEGRFDVALAALAAAPDAQRLKALYELHGAMIADLGKKTAEATRLYRAAVVDYGGTDFQLARQVASWQARQGRIDEARQTLEGLAEAAPEFAIAIPALIAKSANPVVMSATDGMAETYLTLAAALRGQERSAFSLILVQLALDLRPDHAGARLLGADLQEGRNKPELAVAMLAGVSAGDPLVALVRLRQAALADKLGRGEEALRLLDQIAQAAPNRPEVPTMQGDLLRQKKKFAEAIAAYDRALAMLPQPPVRAHWPLYYNRGIALDRAKQWNKAEADLLLALKLQPEQPFVMNYLGYSWTEQGRNLGRAREMIERAVALRPNDGEIMDSLGWVLFRQGDVRGATKYLERAVEMMPEDATINGHLGDIYWAGGRKREAGFQWRRALTLKPDPDDIPAFQAKLRDAAGF